MTGYTIVQCSLDRHASAILEMFNDAISTSTALYDYHPRPPESMVAWFEGKRAGGFPVIGIEEEATPAPAADDADAAAATARSSGSGGGTGARRGLMGFATYDKFRAHPAYKYTVEHSVYVHRAHRGKGVAKVLMSELIALARRDQRHVMVGGIDATTTASIALHEKLGFRHVGTLPQVGFKFGRWLDLAFYQLLLENSPAEPADG